MNLGRESEIVEFKKSTSELESAIISISSMLTKHGEATIYFGVNPNGDVIGQKQINENTLRDISRKISEKIQPQVIPHISIELIDDKEIIKVYVKGDEPAYSADGRYYIRSADEDKKVNVDSLRALLNKDGIPDKMLKTESYNQNLTFKVLRGLYVSHGLTINDENFEKNLGLYTKDGKYNVLAELLADKNNYSVIVARFQGNDKTNLLERTEFGEQCIIVTLNNVLNYIKSLNQTKVKLGGIERKEENYFDFTCFKEAWLNAVVHNRWVNGTPPSVYIYDDNIEVVSDGGIPPTLTLDDYFNGVSKPVNEGLLSVFKTLDLVEHTGHGVPLIVKKYGKKIFKISKETIRIFIPIDRTPIDSVEEIKKYSILNETEQKLIDTLIENPNITTKELVDKLKVSEPYINKLFRSLKDKGYLERVGSNKTGYWTILK